MTSWWHWRGQVELTAWHSWWHWALGWDVEWNEREATLTLRLGPWAFSVWWAEH